MKKDKFHRDFIDDQRCMPAKGVAIMQTKGHEPMPFIPGIYFDGNGWETKTFMLSPKMSIYAGKYLILYGLEALIRNHFSTKRGKS